MADQGSEGFFSPYLRKKRLSAVLPKLQGRVLDIGCGIGTLAEFVAPENYLGMDQDESCLEQARSRFPDHCFISEFKEGTEPFDTVVALAVIEHIPDPGSFMKLLAGFLRDDEGARILLTTPHPHFDWVHNLGSRIGLFSRHANEEHEDLLGKEKLETLGHEAGCICVHYKRFLFGANQVAVFAKETRDF